MPLPGARDDGAGRITARRRSGEVLALTLLPPLVTAWLVPHDPLLLAGHFPWFALLPLLVGVQHGALAAALSSALLVAAGALDRALGGPTPLGALAAFAGGGFASGVIAGHFHDRVQARLGRLSREAAEAARRLSRLVRAHAVLELSHRKLEERLAARRWSLASAFEDTRRALGGARSLGAVGEVVLGVLSSHALVQSATLLTVSLDERGRSELEPCARIGNPPGCGLGHPLVQRALATGRLVALDAESADAPSDQSLLAVVPLGTASGKLLGLVLIHEMSFMAFQAENLKGLAALAALLADMLEERFVAPPLGMEREESVPEAAASPHEAVAPTAAVAKEMARPLEEVVDVALAERESQRALAPDRTLRAVGTAGDESRAPSVEEPRTPESEAESGAVAVDGEFVGTRTGTHRRRGVAQSA